MTFEAMFLEIQLQSVDLHDLRYAPLSLTLSDEDGTKLLIRFPKTRSFRVTDEGDRLIMVERLVTQHQPLHWLYRVQDSDYLHWLNAESNDAISRVKSDCYAIITRNEIVEVLSAVEPIVSPARALSIL